MRANKGRLQTAEHILAKTLENTFPDAKVIIAQFGEDIGRLEITTTADARDTGKEWFEEAVNAIIRRNLSVTKHLLTREAAEKEFDLSRLPQTVKDVRVVEIDGFDRTPCKDPHVENTGEIGFFTILKLERSGKDRYRFLFKVD
jgi:misacylated tRNA(Ala) deacylase